MNNQTNTHQGVNVEHLFANSIFNHPRAYGNMLESINLGHLAEIKAHAEVIGGNKRKGDVAIIFESSVAQQVRINIKSFKKAGYNQLGRSSLPRFCERNQIRSADQAFLAKLWLRKAVEQGGKGVLVKQDEEARVRQIFENIEPAASAILGNDHPEILALFSVNQRRFNLYSISDQVLPHIRQTQIGFTKRSRNIEIGDYIVIQRKGSEHGERGTDIGSIEHRANDVQLKMKVKRFYNTIEPATWYQL